MARLGGSGAGMECSVAMSGRRWAASVVLLTGRTGSGSQSILLSDIRPSSCCELLDDDEATNGLCLTTSALTSFGDSRGSGVTANAAVYVWYTSLGKIVFSGSLDRWLNCRSPHRASTVL